jgi:hypothetical protein
LLDLAVQQARRSRRVDAGACLPTAKSSAPAYG